MSKFHSFGYKAFPSSTSKFVYNHSSKLKLFFVVAVSLWFYHQYACCLRS